VQVATASVTAGPLLALGAGVVAASAVARVLLEIPAVQLVDLGVALPNGLPTTHILWGTHRAACTLDARAQGVVALDARPLHARGPARNAHAARRIAGGRAAATVVIVDQKVRAVLAALVIVQGGVALARTVLLPLLFLLVLVLGEDGSVVQGDAKGDQHPGGQAAQREPARGTGGQGPREGIEAISLHGRAFRPGSAVEAWRQGDAESPSSAVTLLLDSVHPTARRPASSWRHESLNGSSIER